MLKKVLKKKFLLFKIYDFMWNFIMFKINKVSYKNYLIDGKIEIRNFGKMVIGSNFIANSGKMHNPIGSC
jgi:hypothetical protein